ACHHLTNQNDQPNSFHTSYRSKVLFVHTGFHHCFPELQSQTYFHSEGLRPLFEKEALPKHIVYSQVSQDKILGQRTHTKQRFDHYLHHHNSHRVLVCKVYPLFVSPNTVFSRVLQRNHKGKSYAE